MRMNQGVEWAVHACTLLAPLGPGRGLSLSALAIYHGLPAAYMAKQMQLLSRAGLVHASKGKTGGYWLARPPSDISLWDIKQAIDGSEPAFRCSEIRQRGPCAVPRADCRMPCGIASSFARAEAAYRKELKATSLTDVMADVAAHATTAHLTDVMNWYQGNVTSLPVGSSKTPMS